MPQIVLSILRGVGCAGDTILIPAIAATGLGDSMRCRVPRSVIATAAVASVHPSKMDIVVKRIAANSQVNRRDVETGSVVGVGVIREKR